VGKLTRETIRVIVPVEIEYDRKSRADAVKAALRIVCGGLYTYSGERQYAARSGTPVIGGRWPY